MSNLAEHPKAHYISFRSSEILKDLGLSHELQDRVQSMSQWSSYNYQTHVLGGRHYGRVDHFKNYQQMTGTQGHDPLSDFRDKFTYAFPNHFPQHSLNALLLKSLREQDNTPIFNHEYVSHQKTQRGVNIQVKDR
jgi:2,4-dichlorophenol 6-monooxygenase